MKPNLIANIDPGGRVLGRLVAEKKKAFATACLVVVMVFLWVRVLTRNTPDVAEATPTAVLLGTESPSAAAANVSFVELPKVAGRNDLITRDFFACDGWRHFAGGRRKFADIEEVTMLSPNGSEEAIKKLAEKLRLEAVLLSNSPLASINGRVLGLKDRMLIDDGNETYECEVVAIEENTVKIKCREAEITLKLVPVSAVDS